MNAGAFGRTPVSGDIMTKPDLSVEIAGIKLRNPVMTASGTFGYGSEFADYLDLEKIGAIITKGLSLRPKAGNRTPRIVETPGGMLNAIGLQNVGIEAFVREKVPFLRTVNTPVIVNVYGNTLEEYGELAQRLDKVHEVAGLEINISCPNVRQGGIVFGTDPKAAFEVVSLVRESTIKPVIVKLSPNVTDIVEMAHACAEAGADALSLINTLTGMAIDLQKRRPVLANVTGGLSGPAIKPVALRMVWQVARAVQLPIIGIGGIMSATDALEFIVAGATAVQVGTANFLDPAAAQTIALDMERYLAENGIASVREMIGSLQV
jgi:dihydroorotate dehydrogenase (NAD+) catalytic subunit